MGVQVHNKNLASLDLWLVFTLPTYQSQVQPRPSHIPGLILPFGPISQRILLSLLCSSKVIVKRVLTDGRARSLVIFLIHDCPRVNQKKKTWHGSHQTLLSHKLGKHLWCSNTCMVEVHGLSQNGPVELAVNYPRRMLCPRYGPTYGQVDTTAIDSVLDSNMDLTTPIFEFWTQPEWT